MRRFAGCMDEVDRDAVDRAFVVRERVHLVFVPAPVGFGPPVLDEFLQIIEIGAVLPAGVAEVTREAGAAQAILEIRERHLGYSDFKRLFGWHSRSSDCLTGIELAEDH